MGNFGERRQKAAALQELRSRGVFLIDLSEEPVGGVPLSALVPGLIGRCGELKPRAIVLIKATVFDAAFGALTEAGLPVVDEKIPFPGSGQQKKFEAAFTRALQKASGRPASGD